MVFEKIRKDISLVKSNGWEPRKSKQTVHEVKGKSTYDKRGNLTGFEYNENGVLIAQERIEDQLDHQLKFDQPTPSVVVRSAFENDEI